VYFVFENTYLVRAGSDIQTIAGVDRPGVRVIGMPAVAEHVRGVLDKGVRYIYTHLPRLLAGSAKDYLAKAKATN
jgi:hypothetical protein